MKEPAGKGKGSQRGKPPEKREDIGRATQPQRAIKSFESIEAMALRHGQKGTLALLQNGEGDQVCPKGCRGISKQVEGREGELMGAYLLQIRRLILMRYNY